MKRQLFRKLFAVVLISIIFSMLIMTSNVQAMTPKTTGPNLNEILETEEKIMMYDAKTDETKEVDVEELRQVLSSQNKARGGSFDSIAPYDPYANSNMRQNEATPLAADSAERVTNTYNFPNRVTCRIESQEIYGTCAIVGPNVGLTAAHCVFNKDNGNAAYKNWTIYPGYNNGTYYVVGIKYIIQASGWKLIVTNMIGLFVYCNQMLVSN